MIVLNLGLLQVADLRASWRWECQDGTVLPERTEWKAPAHPEEETGPGTQTLQNIITEKLYWVRAILRTSAYAFSDKYSFSIVLKLSVMEPLYLPQSSSFTAVSLGELFVSILNLFFKISPLFLAFSRGDEQTISVSLQGSFMYLNIWTCIQSSVVSVFCLLSGSPCSLLNFLQVTHAFFFEGQCHSLSIMLLLRPYQHLEE